MMSREKKIKNKIKSRGHFVLKGRTRNEIDVRSYMKNEIRSQDRSISLLVLIQTNEYEKN